MRFVSSVEEFLLEKAMTAEAREMVTEAISARFSQIPEKIVNAISTIDDRKVLKEILKKAVLTPSLEQFESEFQNYAKC